MAQPQSRNGARTVAPGAARPAQGPGLPHETRLRSDEPTDADLAGAQAGDAGSFRAVRSRYHDRLVRFVTSYLKGDSHSAEDLVHETFVTAWRKLDQIRSTRHLHAWLYRVARFKAISHLRRRRSAGRMVYSVDFAREHGDSLVDGGQPDPAEVAVSADMAVLRARFVREAIARLPEVFQGVVRLYYVHGLPTGEIAELLSIPHTTVKMRLLRARERLRDMFL